MPDPQTVALERTPIPRDFHQWRETGRSADGGTVIMERRTSWVRRATRAIGNVFRPAGGEEAPPLAGADAVMAFRAADVDGLRAEAQRRASGDGESGDGDLFAAGAERQGQAGNVGADGRVKAWELNNPQLGGKSGVQKFERAYSADPILEAVRLSRVQPALSARYAMAVDDEGVVSDEIAEDANVRMGTDGKPGLLEGGWQKFLTFALTHSTRTGHAAFEAVPYLAPDGRWAVDLHLIHPRTVEDFIVEDGVLTRLIQSPWASGGWGRQRQIDGERLQLFVHDQQSAHDYWGRSMGRTGWRGFRVKEAAWIEWVIQCQRGGSGVPSAEIDAEWWAKLGKGDRNNVTAGLSTVLSQLQGGERSFLNPMGPGVKFYIIGGRDFAGVDIGAAVERADYEIATGGMAPDLILGSTERGARSLGEHFHKLRTASIKSLVDDFRARLVGLPANGHGIVSRWCRWQYGVLQDEVPRLVVEDLQDSKFADVLIPHIPALINCYALTPDNDLEAAIRNAGDAPAMAEQAGPRQRNRISFLRGLGAGARPAVPLPEGLGE